jgi:hypothetical protein
VDVTNLRSEVPIGARVRRDQNRKPLPGRLPDGTLDCPACGSKVQPPGASPTPSERSDYCRAHRTGSEACRRGSSGLRRLTRGLRGVSDRRAV